MFIFFADFIRFGSVVYTTFTSVYITHFLALKNYSHFRPIVISTFHGLYSKPFYSKSMAYADEIITISKTVDEYVLKNYSVNKENLHLIYLWWLKMSI